MKISAPSFIIPDTRINNVLYLKEFVDEVELLFFDSRHDFDMPDEKEIFGLASLNIGYGIHLPTDTDLNTETGWAVIDSYINVLLPLNPLRMVIHPVKSQFFLNEICKRRQHNLIIENTDFYGSFFDDAVSMGLGLCFDNAHAGEHAEDFLKKYHKHIAEYHLQGVSGEKHHKSLEYIEASLLKSIFTHADEQDSTVCLEVFNKNDFHKSYEIFKGLR